MPRFGDYLRDSGVIQAEPFDEALRSQQVFGGRIGTNLVERGFLGLEDLATHLSRFHGVPLPPTAWLEHPDPRALKLVPISLIRRYHVLPLHLERECLHVAMLDPCDAEQLDFLAAAAGRPVAPYVLPEVRLLYWLESHCGIDRHPRYVNLAARLRSAGAEPDPEANQGIAAREHEVDFDAPPQLPIEFAEPSEAAKPAVFGDLAIGDPVEVPGTAEDTTTDARTRATEDELLLEEFAIVDDQAQKTAQTAEAQVLDAPAAPSSPAQVAVLEAQLQGASDVERVIALGLRIARSYATSAALFAVRAGTVCGLRGEGGGIGGRIDEVMLPIDTASIFALPAISGAPFRGRPPHDGIDGRVLGLLSRPDAHEVLIQPIVLRGRVVNLLYADNGSDPMGDTSVAALGALGRTIASAYERLILEKKQQRD